MVYDLDFLTDLSVEDFDSDFVGPEESSHGFKFWLKICIKPSAFGQLCKVKLCSEPSEGCDGYQLLCDYVISLEPKNSADNSVNEFTFAEFSHRLDVQFELVAKSYSDWNEKSDWMLQIPLRDLFSSVDSETKKCKFRVRLKVREMLIVSKENYNEETDQRDFAVLVESEAFYVNLTYLVSLGSSHFENMLDTKHKGINRTVLFCVTAKDFGEFLDFLCTYRKPLITNRNFELMLNLSNQFFVSVALRACESYLSECSNIHVIRKLEYAVEFGFGLLGESLVRRLHNGLPYAHLEALHNYMQINRERLDQQHPDVLLALCIYDDFMIY